MRSIILLTMVILFTFTFIGKSQTSFDAVRLRMNEVGIGARDIALGGNGVALSNGYSAIYWNPGALASVKHSEVSAEFYHLQFENQASFAGNLNSMDEGFTRLRHLGMAVPLPTRRGSLVLAFGYNFVKDFDDYLFFNGFNTLSNGLEFELNDGNGNFNWYPFDKNVEQTEEVLSDGGIHQWSFGGAIAVSPSFDIGATVNFWRGEDEYHLNFRQVDVDNLYNTFPADFYSYRVNENLITDYSATSFKLGGIFKLNHFTRLGMAVEFPTTFTLTENYSFSDELEFDDGFVDAVESEPGQWEYQVKTPYRFDAGIGLNTGEVRLTASATYQDWTQTRFQRPDDFPLNSDYSQLLEENTFIREDYRETINYHLGGEINLPKSNLALRGGYAVYPSPFKNATSEMDRKYYSGGVGIKMSRDTWLDITYQRGNWSRESEDIYTPGGTLEDITENRIFAGLRFRF